MHRGRVAADDAVERAAAQAWFPYWQVRITAHHRAEVNTKGHRTVGQGDGVHEVVDYGAKLRADGDHTVGDTHISIHDIQVSGTVAAVKSCFVGKGHLAGTPPYETDSIQKIVGAVIKEGGAWRVHSQHDSGATCSP